MNLPPFTHETFHHIDHARLARLKPVDEAVEKLDLPLIRFRKLNGILNALTMQIEDGGDHPEVNAHLMDALRVAIVHQVGEAAGAEALNALEVFRQSEAERWEQIRAGTLPPLVIPRDELVAGLIVEGGELNRQDADSAPVTCNKWLAAWEAAKPLLRPEMKTTDAVETAYPSLQFFGNFCNDLEIELRNAGAANPVYHEHRLRYVREFLAQFPAEDTLTRVNFRRAEGEALWELGRQAEAEAAYAALVEQMPDEGWGYIGWSDEYYLYEDSAKDYAQAESILKRALARPGLKEREVVLERLHGLYEEWGKPQEVAAIEAQFHPPISAQKASTRAPSPLSDLPSLSPTLPPAKKPGRNDRCWCGSGKKYKQCHMKLDQSDRQS